MENPFRNYSRFGYNSNPRPSCARNRNSGLDEKGKVNEKLEKAAPFYFFLTKIRDTPETHFEDLTISFSELLDKSLGALEHSVHFNFMVDMLWLRGQYTNSGWHGSPMTIISGDDDNFMAPARDWDIQVIPVHPSYRYGKMHTKLSIFFYIDKSVRFVISTANLTPCDWANRTQGVWISPRCPYMGDDVPINYGESDTLFKVDMIKYMASYDVFQLRQWIFRIQKCDLSAIRVCLVGSIPGQHDDDSYGYKKLNKLLREHVSLPTTKEWDYVAQCSSIGFLGHSPHLWFTTFSKSLHGDGTGDYIPLKVIFPDVGTVLKTGDCILRANCLTYTKKVHNTQKWLRNYFYKWKCDHRYRTTATPHIKTYARLSKDGTKLAWFLLTSANLSKAAWGIERLNGKYEIFSHELGVLFLPSFFFGGDVFKVRKGGWVHGDKEYFPLPYDSPITPYAYQDMIYFKPEPTPQMDFHPMPVYPYLR